MGDIRGMGDIQPSCTVGQDMSQDINPQNMTTNHHQELRRQHTNDINQDLNTDMQDLDRDLSHNLQQQHHHQSTTTTLNQNNYYNSQQVSCFFFSIA